MVVAVDIPEGSSTFPLSEMRDSLNMLGGSDLSFIYPQKIVVGTVYVNSFPGLPTTPFAEATTNEPNAGTNLVIKGGVDVNDGIFTADMTAGTTLTLDGNSTIGAVYSSQGAGFNVFTSDTGPTLGTKLKLNGTITLGAVGQNTLSLEDVNTIGGTVVENGESDLVHVGVNPSGDPDAGIGTVTGTDFRINSGVMTMLGPSGFKGTIGPVSSSDPNAPAIGIFGEVEIYNALQTASATFDTSTGMLSLLDASGKDLGDLHFAGNVSGLRLNAIPLNGLGYIAINDAGSGGVQGNIHLTFHS